VAYTQPHGIRPPRVDFDPVYYNTAGEFILEGGVAAVPGNWSIGGTLTVAGQATFNGGFANPAALRNASNLNIDGLTTHGDSAYAILATDRVVATSAAFTASRTWTLPAANAVNPGQSLTITDEANGITSTNTLVVSRAGSDTVVAQGTTVTSITLSSAGALITLISDGSSKWIVQSLRQAPQVSVFTSGTSQTYTTSIGALYLRVRMVGGGGGGGALATNGGLLEPIRHLEAGRQFTETEGQSAPRAEQAEPAVSMAPAPLSRGRTACPEAPVCNLARR